MHDLPGGMYARIGPTSARHLDSVVGYFKQGFFEALLHAETDLLALPAVVRGPVVLNTERNAQVISRVAC